MRPIIGNIILFYFWAASSVTLASNDHSKALKVGDKAPDFTITDVSGNPISLSSLKGKVVLLDFWASWCGYCKISNEEFIPVYNKYHDQGFEIFSVSLDANKESWIKAIQVQELPWTYHGSDLRGWQHSEIAQTYSIEVLPTTFLLDENGMIIAKDLDESDLDKKLNWYFNQQIRFYPVTANSKLFFTDKTKYQIEDNKGIVLLKGKDKEADISELSPGEYLIKYENKSEKFVKNINTQSPVTFSPDKVDDTITLSSEANYEIYTMQGKLLKSGNGLIINLGDLTPDIYYISIEGDIYSFLKK